MNKTVLASLSFLFGAAAGVLIGIVSTKRKYEDIADREIESVKKLYESHFNKQPEENKEVAPEEKEEKLPNGKTPYGKMYKPDGVIPGDKPIDLQTNNGEIKNVKKDEPHFLIISPEFFRESEYESITLTYYADKVLADEDYIVINNPNEVIGDEALNAFGRYEDDCVYVRDNKLRVDYEIILDTRKYSEVVLNKPENQPNYP